MAEINVFHIAFFHCRDQVKDFQEELLKQESNFRKQVAGAEKKAHDNWVRYFSKK